MFRIVGRLVPVEILQDRPVEIEMLRDGIGGVAGEGMDEALGDPEGTVTPERIAGDVRDRHAGFHGVHVRIGAAIGFLIRPVRREALAEDAFLLAPEMPVHMASASSSRPSAPGMCCTTAEEAARDTKACR